MTRIAVVSMKGGVGKTTTTANVAAALAAKLGPGQVGVLDLDPQNALHLHLGLGAGVSDGVCRHSLSGLDWREVCFPSQFGVVCLPYGSVSEPEREAFQALLSQDPDWIPNQLQRMGLGNQQVLLIDTPPGPSVYLRQALACADVVLVVLLADAASYSTVPAMEAWIDDVIAQRPNLKSVYVLNQVDTTVSLNRDVADVLREHLRKRSVLLSVHRDEAVCEALAYQQPVLNRDPVCRATYDLQRLADWVLDAAGR
jgi:cellulose synthase operon protein YhjQ